MFGGCAGGVNRTPSWVSEYRAWWLESSAGLCLRPLEGCRGDPACCLPSSSSTRWAGTVLCWNRADERWATRGTGAALGEIAGVDRPGSAGSVEKGMEMILRSDIQIVTRTPTTANHGPSHDYRKAQRCRPHLPRSACPQGRTASRQDSKRHSWWPLWWVGTEMATIRGDCGVRRNRWALGRFHAVVAGRWQARRSGESEIGRAHV